MKKAALVLALSIVSASCLQSKAWSKPSLLLQMPSILAASQQSDTTQIMIGDNGIVTAFKGKNLRSNIEIYHGYELADSTNYEYSPVTAPSGLSVSVDGVISYAVPDSADTQSIPLSFQMKDKTTGKIYTKNVQLVVMETEIIASGTVGPAGGQIADEFESVVLTVPQDTFTEDAFVEVLRAVGKEGDYAYTIRSSVPMLQVASLLLPDPISLEAPEGSQSRKFQQAQAGGQAEIRATENGWTSWKRWKARYIRITGAKNRLRSGFSENPGHEYVDIFEPEVSSELFSLCKKEPYVCSGTPVVFIHGYNIGGDLGGGKETWGKLPEKIKEEGYAVFEFTWRTNAKFSDAAADFANAIGLIQEKSGKKSSHYCALFWRISQQGLFAELRNR